MTNADKPSSTADATETNAQEFLGPNQAKEFQENGFTVIRGFLKKGQCELYRHRALELREAWLQDDPSRADDAVFAQMVNVWTHDEVIREMTLNPVLGRLATLLAGTPLRLWHDQLLIKEGGRSKPTEFHQDQPYWPHTESAHPISAWIALQDTPPQRGCMTFIPKSHERTDLTAQDLSDATSLFGLCPEFEWAPRITQPLQAGDLTFHHGRCAHMATPNITDDFRVAHVVIFIDQTTRFNGGSHVVTDNLGLTAGDLIEGDRFPPV
ncbi:MAG: hypothetical protein SynsKO_38390 [Synoicihabitans sp.]